jgi:hypothetical protein
MSFVAACAALLLISLVATSRASARIVVVARTTRTSLRKSIASSRVITTAGR